MQRCREKVLRKCYFCTKHSPMESIILTVVGISFGGFIVGLGGKNWNVKKRKPFWQHFFNYLTTISLIIFLAALIGYKIVI